MNNPGHNHTFNKDAERLDREEQPRLHQMNTSREWDEAEEEARQDAAAAVNDSTETVGEKIDAVVAGIDPVAALEARRFSLAEKIRSLKYDLTVPENSASQNFQYQAALNEAESTLHEVEEQITALSPK